MKVGVPFVLCLLVFAQFTTRHPEGSQSEIICGQTITENTILEADLPCPVGTPYALIIGASNITLDLGGHTLWGTSPAIGIYADGVGDITIRNGTLEGHHTAVFLHNTYNVMVEHLHVRQLSDPDPNNFIFGIHIDHSQNITVRDSLFEYLPEFHREAVEVFESDVIVSDIEVRGGGAGVNFSYAGSCDPLNRPANGIVRNSKFTIGRGIGVLLACSSSTYISGNVISPGEWNGIVADGPFPGAVTGAVFVDNVIDGQYQGVQLGGTSNVTVTHNIIHSSYQGIALGPSLGCTTPETGWDCFYPTGITISDNQVFGNTLDLYHSPQSQDNTWEGNACETKEGDEILACLPPTAVLTTNYPSGKPGSFFTVEGFNFAASEIVTITINSVTLGTVSTDDTGKLLFMLDTEYASEGFYIVAASSAGAGSSLRISLSIRNLNHEQEDEGTVFVVPGNIGSGIIYLPLVFR
jgi:hypothetical protein